MNLIDLGYTSEMEYYRLKNGLVTFSVGRVTQEHRERYIVSEGDNEYEAEITGNLRFTAASRADFPAVGDWVSMTIYDSDLAMIHRVWPRKTVLERQAVGKTGEKQIISANIDVALIVQSIDNNFSLNRLERYLSICYGACIEPVFILSKTDLATDEQIKSAMKDIEKREKKVKTILLSNISQNGLDAVNRLIEKGKTYCVVGSSGVGKSTLINSLLNKHVLNTGEISHSTGKGRHITSHRELLILDNGGIIIDTPGMKELGIIEKQDGVRSTFEEIFNLSLKCKYSDCTHTIETGCRILEAVEKGEINNYTLENWKKLQREQQRFQITVAEKHKKDREFGKMVRSVLKEKRKNNI